MPESIRKQTSRAADGDRSAVAWLYDTFAPGLRRRLGQRFAAFRELECDDLLHDAFVYVLSGEGRVLRRFLARLDGAEPTAPALARFLWSAACGVASNRRRSVLRRRAAPLEERRLTVTAGSETRTVARDLLTRLGSCLLRAGERPHLYFQLRYIDGLTPAEIARVTGWSRRITYRLKQKLDATLERCLDELGVTER